MEPNVPLEVPERLVRALADRYRIVRPLGAGGMATVYLAEDLRHSRRVAVKVLKPELAAVLGAERFLTEIKTTANLQHPHILPLFDSGEADTYLYYVMPFVEGESLRDRLDREHQLAVEDAVRIARDVADALDYAHRHGVIHRDIKPANILLHDGRPLVADFGIALAISAAGGGRMTETGLSLGTPHYMSPEQASAERDLSARSDVYSLGCVLYEMLAGEPPHTGPTAASILMRILTEQPRPISELRATVPAHVASAVSKAVEKLPADRFETARQFREALEDPAFRFTRATSAMMAPGAAAPAIRTSTWDRRSVVLAGAAVLLAASTLWLAIRPDPVVDNEGSVVAFQLADSVGPMVVPIAGPGGWLGYRQRRQLHLRAPGRLLTEPVPGLDSINDVPRLSPDGEWVAYVESQNNQTSLLRKAPSRGGNPVTLASLAGNAFNPHWSADGWMYLAAGTPGSWWLLRMPDTGGPVDTLFAGHAFVPYGVTSHPGTDRIIFGLFNATVASPRLVSLDLGSRDTTTLLEDGYHPRWVAEHLVLFARGEGSIFAATLDDRGRVSGSPVPVLDGLAEASPDARYDISPSGTLIYVSGRATGRSSGTAFSLQLDSIAGGREKIPLPPSDHWDAKFSPDGRRVAYIRNDHIWVYDLDLGTHTQLTRDGSRHHNPAWSSDGMRVAFAAADAQGADVDVFVTAADGTSAIESLGGSPGDDYPAQWLGDTAVLVYTQGLYGQNVLLITPGAKAPTPLLQADWIERNPRVSADGRWIAYMSDESGRLEVYVRRWPSLANKVRISEGDAGVTINSFPLWSPDSRSLYFRQGTQIIAATVEPRGDSLRVTARRQLGGPEQGYLQDMHPDGKRLLMLAEDVPAAAADPAPPGKLIVITNWLSTLRDRLK